MGYREIDAFLDEERQVFRSKTHDDFIKASRKAKITRGHAHLNTAKQLLLDNANDLAMAHLEKALVIFKELKEVGA